MNGSFQYSRFWYPPASTNFLYSSFVTSVLSMRKSSSLIRGASLSGQPRRALPPGTGTIPAGTFASGTSFDVPSVVSLSMNETVANPVFEILQT